MSRVHRKALVHIWHELDIFLAFSWRDWSATIIPGSIWGIGAALEGHVSLTSILYRFLRLVVWLTLYVYFFDLSNQLTGVAEDRVNKPDRPIPCGKVTLAGAKRRAAAALIAFVAIAILPPSLGAESTCWVLTTGFLCCTSAGQHWFGKNVLGMMLGTWALLSASWRSITPPTPEAQHHIVAIVLWVGTVLNIQDLRDVAGDRARGRRTLPVVYGDVPARRFIAFLAIPSAIAVLWVWGVLAVAPITLTVAHIWLGYRVLRTSGGPRYDHKTYMMLTYIFCLILTLIAVKDIHVHVRA
ncbi:UbiA prenyltransferase family [Mycena vulgaris]|nr:UbiA prenyltransferase family [Mycena vulgaris]